MRVCVRAVKVVFIFALLFADPLSGTPRLSRYSIARVGVCLDFDGADFYTRDVDDVKSDLVGGANYMLLLIWVPCSM